MKNRNYIVAFAGTFIMLTACSRDGNNSGITPGIDSTLPATGTPVETSPPNANYRPAFTGQTRIAGVRTTTTYQANVLTSALSAPWGITSLPDGRLLITQKGGTMRIVTTSGSVSSPITGLPGLPGVNASGQGGLQGYASIHNSVQIGINGVVIGH